mmetsp:Transcript_27755/g.26813  ORF Transcript_27755/g.26813 Transcript_27755/m.26813 type:complete len:87 (+) Transcript_27755:182-442(+)
MQVDIFVDLLQEALLLNIIFFLQLLNFGVLFNLNFLQYPHLVLLAAFSLRLSLLELLFNEFFPYGLDGIVIVLISILVPCLLFSLF